MNLGKKEYTVTPKKKPDSLVFTKKNGVGEGVSKCTLQNFAIAYVRKKDVIFFFHFDLTLILHILTKSNFLTSCSREKVELRKKIYRKCICIACCLHEQFE